MIFPLAPLAKSAVAVKATVFPATVVATVGVMLILETVETYIKLAGEVTPFIEAVMLLLPTVTPVAIPVFEPIVATPGVALVQAARLVISVVVAFDRVAVAVKAIVFPTIVVGSDEVTGVTLILLIVSTDSVTEFDVLPASEAVMAVEPAVRPKATPLVALIEATVGVALVQATWLVMSTVAPFE